MAQFGHEQTDEPLHELRPYPRPSRPTNAPQTLGLPKMNNQIRQGSRVRLVELPEWLVHDLPGDEQAEMRAFVGKVALVDRVDRVDRVDAAGYVWIGFGATCSSGEDAQYRGHSFGVPVACLQLV